MFRKYQPTLCLFKRLPCSDGDREACVRPSKSPRQMPPFPRTLHRAGSIDRSQLPRYPWSSDSDPLPLPFSFCYFILFPALNLDTFVQCELSTTFLQRRKRLLIASNLNLRPFDAYQTIYHRFSMISLEGACQGSHDWTRRPFS